MVHVSLHHFLPVRRREALRREALRTRLDLRLVFFLFFAPPDVGQLYCTRLEAGFP